MSSSGWARRLRSRVSQGAIWMISCSARELIDLGLGSTAATVLSRAERWPVSEQVSDQDRGRPAGRREPGRDPAEIGVHPGSLEIFHRNSRTRNYIVSRRPEDCHVKTT